MTLATMTTVQTPPLLVRCLIVSRDDADDVDDGAGDDDDDDVDDNDDDDGDGDADDGGDNGNANYHDDLT